MTTRWRDVRKGKMTEAQLAAVDRKVRADLLRMDLRELRKMAGKTQVEVADAMKVSQGQLSLTEHREDHRLSTLKKYVKALGGELHLVADFGNKQIRLEA